MSIIKSDIANLIDKYPLNDKEAELLLSCTIAESWFTNPTEVYVKSILNQLQLLK